MTSYVPPVQTPPQQRSRRGLLIALPILGLALLLALALVIVLLLRSTSTAGQPALASGNAIGTPTASATTAMSAAATLSPTASTATSSTTSTKPVTVTRTTASGPVVDKFSVVPQSAISATTVTCKKAENLRVDFQWSTKGATGVAFGVATLDASTAPYISNLPATGSLGSAQAVVFPCYADAGDHTQFYTLTVTSTGQKVSRTITLKEKYVP